MFYNLHSINNENELLSSSALYNKSRVRVNYLRMINKIHDIWVNRM